MKLDEETMRRCFEEAIRATKLRDNTPLGPMVINGRFDHYMDPDTDTLWIGFRMALRYQHYLDIQRQKIVYILKNAKKPL